MGGIHFKYTISFHSLIVTFQVLIVQGHLIFNVVATITPTLIN